MESSAKIKRTKVLVLDDDEAILAGMVNLLEQEAVEVISASSVDEALDLAVKTQPDLILSDLSIPRRNGIEFAIALRKHSALKKTPLIAISNLCVARIPSMALAAGFNAVLPKPLTAEMVKELLP